MHYKTTLIALICLLTMLPAQAGDVVKLQADRLPDLNIPRAGHQLFYANGELTVAGGHTDGFVPTQTAEYFKDGKWHTLQMTYPHDFGLSVVLRSGKVLLAGGCEQPLGIGQTYTAELYDPQTHTFRGFGNMQHKRTWASALELDSGKVVIAGNWYHTDGIEVFNEAMSENGDHLLKQSFTFIKDVKVQRAHPYIFRMADNDALIFGNINTKGDTIYTTYADRLKGDSVMIPLFETWHPLVTGVHDNEAGFIGDAAKDNFTYLLAVKDSTGQVAIARVNGTDFSILPTPSPIPMFCKGDTIEYGSNFIVDHQAGKAYLLGFSRSFHTAIEGVRLYVLSIDYLSDKKPILLYYADSLDVIPDYTPLLTPEGNLLIAGGMKGSSNFTPSAAVYLLRLGSKPEAASSGMAWWIWMVIVLLALLALALVYYVRQRRQKPVAMETGSNGKDFSYQELMERINSMMEQQRLYLNSDLNLAYLANELGLNRNYVSDCINSQTGGSFTQYVTNYRIEHAKNLLRNKPDMKISDVWMYCGFTNEASFFRTFKSVTGMTPKEWTSQL